MSQLIRLPNKKVWFVVVALGIAVSAVCVAQSTIAKQLTAWHVLPQPEPFTAIFFNDSQALPKHAAPHTPLTADVTIKNMQYEPTVYTYKIIASMGGGPEQLLKEGSCTVEHGATCAIDGKVTVPALGPRVQIRTVTEYVGRTHDDITKRLRTQSLHYWVDLGSPTGSAS